MADELSLKKHAAAVRRFIGVGVAALGLSVALVLAAALVPMQSRASGSSMAGREAVPTIPRSDPDLHQLLVKVAGSRLIRPAQVQPAVKDDGAAQELLARLTLQSIVQLGGEPVAYVRIENKGVQTLKEGGRILAFVVEEIKGGRIKLSLDGVMVNLTY